MKVQVSCSEAQEELIGDHLLIGKTLYVHPDERARLIRLVGQRWPSHKIVAAEIDLEKIKWQLELQEVTVTN